MKVTIELDTKALAYDALKVIKLVESLQERDWLSIATYLHSSLSNDDLHTFKSFLELLMESSHTGE